MSEFQNVKNWSVKFKQHTPIEISIPSLETRKLRARLILEEVLEIINEGLGLAVDHVNHLDIQIQDLRFEENYYKLNIPKLLDGTCDTRWVLYGTEIAFGINEEISNKCFEEINRSNNSKLWTANELRTVYYKNIEVINNNPYITKTIDGHTQELIGHKYFEYPQSSWNDNDRCWLVLDPGGKAVKSPSYSKANLEQFIKLQEPTTIPHKCIYQEDSTVCKICGS